MKDSRDPETIPNDAFFAWPDSFANAANPSETHFKLDELAPANAMSRLLLKLRRNEPAPEGWDLRGMEDGGVKLPGGTVEVAQRLVRFGTGLATLVLDLAEHTPVLAYSEGKKRTVATRAQIARFGIRNQADFDARLLDAFLARERLGSKGSPGELHVPAPMSVVYRPPTERARLRQQLLDRVYLRALAKGLRDQDDLGLLQSLREVASRTRGADPEPASRGTSDDRFPVVLATLDAESLVVREAPVGAARLYVAEDRDGAWAKLATPVDLRRFGISNESDMKTLLGRALLRYSLEGFLSDE
jgi:hypothetical protein